MVSIAFSGLDLTDRADVARAVQVLRALHQRALRGACDDVQVSFDGDIAFVTSPTGRLGEENGPDSDWIRRYYGTDASAFFSLVVDAVRRRGEACAEEVAEQEGVSWSTGRTHVRNWSREVVRRGEALPVARRVDPARRFSFYECA
jgi:hypothetical protein